MHLVCTIWLLSTWLLHSVYKKIKFWLISAFFFHLFLELGRFGFDAGLLLICKRAVFLEFWISVLCVDTTVVTLINDWIVAKHKRPKNKMSESMSVNQWNDVLLNIWRWAFNIFPLVVYFYDDFLYFHFFLCFIFDWFFYWFYTIRCAVIVLQKFKKFETVVLSGVVFIQFEILRKVKEKIRATTKMKCWNGLWCWSLNHFHIHIQQKYYAHKFNAH